MIDTHYDLLSIAYDAYLKNDYSYLEELESLKDIPEVQEFFQIGENWITIANNVKAGAQIDDENLIFYNVSFSDWAQKYLIKDTVVNKA
jgi:hypothetical protein